MTDDPRIAEIRRRSRLLCENRGHVEHQGNGYFTRVYVAGKVQIQIYGDYDKMGQEKDIPNVRSILAVDYGGFMALEEPWGSEDEWVTGDDLMIWAALEELRRHMVLDDLADV